MERVGIGLVGVGFAGKLHAKVYREMDNARVVAAASRTREKVEGFAETNGIPFATTEVEELLARPEVDCVDVCAPLHVHADIVLKAAQAGKHVICEKPLTGYCGQDLSGDVELVGKEVPKSRMFEKALASADAMVAAAAESGVKLMYAENWVYAPPVQKARALLEASGGTLFDIRAEESHSGSHSPYASLWKYSGGGSLMRLGSHPIGAVLYLKAVEGILKRGAPIRVRTVTAETGNVTANPSFEAEPRKWVRTGWQDVEDWSCAILTFEDASKATITSSDVCLGGIQNRMELYLSNARISCNLNPNNLCTAYSPEPSVFEKEYIAEKLETKSGWNWPSVGEEWVSGYPEELRDFVECIQKDRQPLSDGELGREVVKVIYAAYVSAEEGRRVEV